MSWRRHRLSPSLRLAVSLAAAVASWGTWPNTAEIISAQQASTTSVIKYVFVIAMENTDADQIYGKPGVAPFINTTLMPASAWAANFNDELPREVRSEPHYIWMEAGTNAFADTTFT